MVSWFESRSGSHFERSFSRPRRVVLKCYNRAVPIPTPTSQIVKNYLAKWDRSEYFVIQDKALRLLFEKTYPKNTKIEHILIKVDFLNQAYSTNLYYPFMVARHILKLNIDEDLRRGDYRIIDKIAKVNTPRGDKKFYSFASKYCSFHYPERYPIYDSFIEKVLWHFRRRDDFYEFRRKDIKEYEKFVEILNKFKEFYGLTEFNAKDLDRYLWQIGKEFFF